MKEEDLVIFLEDFCDFLNGLEASIAKIKMQIARLVGVEVEEEKPRFSWNPDAIKWRKTEGFRGEYERYPAEGEKAEASSDYRLLLEDLKKHGGRLTREDFFYWLFMDGSTIGRKPGKAKAEVRG